MTWNGSGIFDPPGTPEFPAIPGDLIRAEYFNTVIQALCDAFLNVLPRDGQAAMTGNINANNLYTVSNLKAALQNGEAVRYNEFVALQAQVASIGATPPFILFQAGIV